MKMNKILALLLAILMLVSAIPGGVFAEEKTGEVTNDTLTADYSGDVGKYVRLANPENAFNVSGGESVPNTDDSLVFYYDEFEEGTVMHITDWYVDAGTTGLWYKVEF